MESILSQQIFTKKVAFPLSKGMFPTKGSNLCSLHWQANSLPLFVWYMYQEHLLPLCGLFFFHSFNNVV